MESESWVKRYKEQGDILEEKLGKTVKQAMEDVGNRPGATIVDVNLSLRDIRLTFEPRYCLLLYGSSTNEQLLRHAWKATGSTDVNVFTRGREASLNVDVCKSLRILMSQLDEKCGMHAVMIGKVSDTDGPLQLNPPNNYWFHVMSSTAELAWAIIVICIVKDNLVREMRYLTDAGLRNRILYFEDKKLLSEDSNGKLIQWELEEIDSAVCHVAESSVNPPNRDKIDAGY